MNTITLKGVPPSVHRALKARARTHGRSLNREILAVLEGATRAAPLDAAAIGARARAVRESMATYLTEKDLSAFKQAGRR
jgi:plasmid stability protein